MKYLFAVVACQCLIFSIWAINGVDLYSPTSITTFTCLRNNGNSFAIIRAFRSTGAFDNNANNNLQNAKAAGLATDIYMFPCRGKDATSQVNQLFFGISTTLFSTVWIDIEANPSSGCSWIGYSADSNCNFVMSLIKGI